MKKCLVILVVAMCLLLSSCQKVIVTPADELTSYQYKSEYENGNVVSLYFEGDKATLDMVTKRGERAQICGFCEISESDFVIFDSKTGVAYPFGYTVYYDRVDIMYDENVLSLDKIC